MKRILIFRNLLSLSATLKLSLGVNNSKVYQTLNSSYANVEERVHLGEVDIDMRSILKLMVGWKHVTAWTGISWLRIGHGGSGL